MKPEENKKAKQIAKIWAEEFQKKLRQKIIEKIKEKPDLAIEALLKPIDSNLRLEWEKEILKEIE